ncbi:unnamed protein product [Macrosiphum euphorbiae]|uniref:Uncharacterized protein n=1 Tax=Macrosiphum euphorbiae TaxID=13131 RepID=A0AAV0VK57_9HEMI|nr:unnamed protein product [Macrosiphum euphorbiae]
MSRRLPQQHVVIPVRRERMSVDFSTLHYGSPALNLSSFLYISTTQRMRESHWDHLLDTYCAALAASVYLIAPKWMPRWPRQPSMDLQKRRFACHSCYATEAIHWIRW